VDTLKALGLELAVQLLPYLVTALAAVAVAWLRSRLLRIEAQNVTIQVELEASLDPELKGEKKLARARELLAQRTKVLVAMKPDQLIERSIPNAREITGPTSVRAAKENE
jgi:hypothetical protein